MLVRTHKIVINYANIQRQKRGTYYFRLGVAQELSTGVGTGFRKASPFFSPEIGEGRVASDNKNYLIAPGAPLCAGFAKQKIKKYIITKNKE